jgi:hypothetical protein
MDCRLLFVLAQTWPDKLCQICLKLWPTRRSGLGHDQPLAFLLHCGH